MKYKFKKLEIKDSRSPLKKLIQSINIKKTALFMVIGAIGGFSYLYLTQGQQMNEIITKDIINYSLIGAWFGFFITNSPCARGRC